MTDFYIEDAGSVVLVTPQTDGAAGWLAENVEAESWQWLGASLAVEHRCAPDLLGGILADGLTTKGAR